MAVLHPRLAGRDAGGEALLPDRRARHRLRHHLLLGRPHDDDGPARHGASAVPRRLHPCAGPRREGPEDVEVERQRHRPARADRRLWRRRAPLHARRHGGAGPRHQAQLRPRRGLPQFRDQAVERRALRRDQRLRAGERLRSSDRPSRPSTAGSPARASARSPPSPRRSKPIASTRLPAPSTPSSGTSSATGISS